MPSAIVSPDEEERDRLEAQRNSKFRRGGAGRVVVGESKLNVSVLQQSMGDLAQFAEIRATMEDSCNAFHVPIAYMTTNVNMARPRMSNRSVRQIAKSAAPARRELPTTFKRLL